MQYNDMPAVLLLLTIWCYWFGVGAMIVRARRKTHDLAGLVPEQSFERARYYVSKRRSGAIIAATSSVPAQRRFHPRRFQIPAYSVLIDSVSLCRRASDFQCIRGRESAIRFSEPQVAEIEKRSVGLEAHRR